MTIYERVKAAVTVRDAAERYGQQVSRSGMTCCLFHEGRHPSMKLNDSFYYCFGCGTYGDVVNLTAKLCGLNPYDAAVKLVSDFGLENGTEAVKSGPVYSTKPKDNMMEVLYWRLLAEYAWIMRENKQMYAPHTPFDEVDDRYVEACQMLDYVEYLLDCLSSADEKERAGALAAIDRDKLAKRIDESADRLLEECDYEPEHSSRAV